MNSWRRDRRVMQKYEAPNDSRRNWFTSGSRVDSTITNGCFR
jgi:hypothetical protein